MTIVQKLEFFVYTIIDEILGLEDEWVHRTFITQNDNKIELWNL